MQAARDPKVAVVVPVMGHPVLVDEALASAAEQMAGGVVSRLIVVNDGCRFRETGAALAAWQAHLWPRCTVVPQRNAGLAAARNAGIAVALREDVDAIYLLDADNRLASGAGAAFHELLLRHPGADWFYPEFDFFGQQGHFAGERAPSALMHMIYNFSEAGSLIRRRVFDSGLRFDETLKQGYEDWDFFLGAAARGFTGQPAARPLLKYRKRPASMLAESHSFDAALRQGLRQRQPWLFRAGTALTAEHRDFPRYAAIAGPDQDVRLGTDPEHWRGVSFDDYEAQVMRALAAPLHHHAPGFALFAPAQVLDALSASGTLRGLLWNAERLLEREGCGLVSLRLRPGASFRMEIEASGTSGETPEEDAAMVLCPLSVIETHVRAGGGQSAQCWAQDLARRRITLSLPLFAGLQAAPQEGWAIAAESLARLASSRYGKALGQSWDWRDTGGAQLRSRAEAVRMTAHGGVVFPLIPMPHRAGGTQPRNIAFATSIFDAGGVEKVILALARVLGGRGHRCHLVVTGRGIAHLDAADMAVFSSVSCLADASALDWAGAEYQGTAETSWGNPAQRADLEGLLRPMDVVINAHSAAVHKVAGALRRGGTRMVDHEHLVEVSTYGRSYGPPILALGYEHDYDAILTCSQRLAEWMHAHGVPAEKLIPVVNAPGYEMSAEEVAGVLAQRADPMLPRPLSILYFGRMDAQKGIDRVAGIFRRLEASGRGFRLAAAGRAVMGAQPDAQWPRGTVLHGAVTGVEAITALYAATDILILPSRYEGLPLVVLEAQRCGVVPMATDVGAVAEAIADGENGYLIAEEGCVEAAVQGILALDEDRARLQALSRCAAARVRDWQAAAAGLVEWLEGDFG